MPLRAVNRDTAGDYGRASSVVANGNVEPVREECIFRVPEHASHVGGVFLTGIEIGIISHLNGHLHLDLVHSEKHHLSVIFAIAEGGILGVKDLCNAVSHQAPGLFSVGNEIVQGVLQKYIVGQWNSFKIS